MPVDDGFLGILVITEMLSRYPYAVAIKFKTAIEISGHLYIYISIFGPPHSKGSDNGTEFVHEIVDTMLSNRDLVLYHAVNIERSLDKTSVLSFSNMHDYIRSSASIKSTTNVMDLKELL